MLISQAMNKLDPVIIYRSLKMGSDMDVSENSGTPKWMVYNGKPY